MSAFKPNNNLLTDTILFEAIAQIREQSDYRRQVEAYVLEQNGLASVRQLSEDKKRLFVRIVDAIINEGVDEIDPSMYVMNEAYGKALHEVSDKKRGAAYVERAGREAAMMNPDTKAVKPGMGDAYSRSLQKKQRTLDTMKDQGEIHQTFQKAGEVRNQVGAIQRETTKPRTQQDEDHSPINPGSYKKDAQPAAKLHNALGRHLANNVKEKDVEEGLSRYMGQRHDVSTAGNLMRAIAKGTREAGRDVAAATLRAGKKLGTAGLRAATPLVKKMGLREEDLGEMKKPSKDTYRGAVDRALDPDDERVTRSASDYAKRGAKEHGKKFGKELKKQHDPKGFTRPWDTRKEDVEESVDESLYGTIQKVKKAFGPNRSIVAGQRAITQGQKADDAAAKFKSAANIKRSAGGDKIRGQAKRDFDKHTKNSTRYWNVHNNAGMKFGTRKEEIIEAILEMEGLHSIDQLSESGLDKLEAIVEQVLIDEGYDLQEISTQKAQQVYQKTGAALKKAQADGDTKTARKREKGNFMSYKRVTGAPIGKRPFGEDTDNLQEISPELLRRAATKQGIRRYQKDKRGNLPSYKAGDAMTTRMDKFEQGAKDAERRDELHDMTPRMRELYRQQGGRIPAGTDMKKPAPKPEKK
jgi:hypothetical protein